MEKPYLFFSTERVSAGARLANKAALKNAAFLKDKTLEENRETHNRLADLRPMPTEDVHVEPVSVQGVPCEWIYTDACTMDKVIVYIHGGGWAVGNLKTAQAMGIFLAEAASIRVLAVEYRLAPEYPYPIGLCDCETVYHWLLAQGIGAQDIALMGDSAGGNLSLCLTHKLKAQGIALPCALGLASPVVLFGEGSELWRQKPDLVYTMYEGQPRDIFSLYAPSEQWKDPLISPTEGDLSGFPPILIHVGGAEELVVDCAAFGERAYEQGVDILVKVFREMTHDFTIVGAPLRESKQSIDELAAFFQKHLLAQ